MYLLKKHTGAILCEGDHSFTKGKINNGLKAFSYTELLSMHDGLCMTGFYRSSMIIKKIAKL